MLLVLFRRWGRLVVMFVMFVMLVMVCMVMRWMGVLMNGLGHHHNVLVVRFRGRDASRDLAAHQKHCER